MLSEPVAVGDQICRRYVAYYRVSTEQQRKSGLGLEGQRMIARAFAARSDGAIVGEYTEIESGRKNDRPCFAEALRQCRASQATLLIARLDRLSRNVALIAKLIETGTDFIAADMPHANSFTKHILAAVAEKELKLISERLKAALAAAKARGKKIGGFRRIDPDQIRAATAAGRAAQAEKARTRAIAFAPLLRDLKAQGKSLRAIGLELSRMEIETPRGKRRWHEQQVRQLFLLSGQEPPPIGGLARPWRVRPNGNNSKHSTTCNPIDRFPLV